MNRLQHFMTYIAAILFALPLAAAHIVATDAGFASGILHPLTGIDHLLAILAVGIISVRMGGKAIWAVPGSFALAMLGGGLLAYLGVALPAVEIGIALSVLVLGIIIALSPKIPVGWALGIMGVFGILHGHSHGAELPLVTNAVQFTLGFMSSTIALLAAGVGIGYFAAKTKFTTQLVRYAGIGMAVAGVAFIALA